VPDKKAQDVLYIHDTLDLFAAELATLRVEWLEKHRPSLSPKIAGGIALGIREQFGAVDDVIRTAARIPQDRSLTPQRLRATSEYGLAQIVGGFGSP
jgi:hypothetical protein